MKKLKKLAFLLALALCMNLFVLPGHVAAADSPGSGQVTITKTNILAESVFNSDGYGSLSRGEYSALIDQDGKIIISSQDDFATYFCYDGIISLIRHYIGDEYLTVGLSKYYNLNGDPVIHFEELDNEDVDENGREYHESTIHYGYHFENGYAVVISVYRRDFSSGTVVERSKWQIIDKNGNVTYELPEEDVGEINRTILGIWFGEGLISFFKREGTSLDDCTVTGEGYMDPYGKTVIDLSGRGYTDLGPFYNGLAYAVNQNEKVGFIDKNGKEVIPCIYDETESFYLDGLCTVEKDGKWGYIDKNGNPIIPLEYDDACGAGNGLASVGMNGKYGLVNRNNEIVVPLEYDDISSSEGGVVYAIKDGIVYIIRADSDSGGGTGKPSTRPVDQQQQTQQPLVPFTDVSPDDWFYDDVVWAYQLNLIQGIDGVHFDPHGQVSQAVIVTVLARIADADLTRYENETEPDLPAGQYYTAAAIWAKRSGLLPEGAFTGTEPTSRDKMAVMLTKYLSSMGKDTNPPAQYVTFDDAAEMSPEGNAAFQVLYQHGIFRGTGGMKMEPAGTTTRAQFVALMHRIYDTAVN